MSVPYKSKNYSLGGVELLLKDKTWMIPLTSLQIFLLFAPSVQDK